MLQLLKVYCKTVSKRLTLYGQMFAHICPSQSYVLFECPIPDSVPVPLDFGMWLWKFAHLATKALLRSGTDVSHEVLRSS